MNYKVRRFRKEDKGFVLQILNHYVKNSFAAYPEGELPEEHFGKLFQIPDNYPFYVITCNGDVVGFGLLRPFYYLSTFSHTVEITYFILPEHTMKGLGSRLLNLFEEDAKKLGIENLLASISSLNAASINFHLKFGYTECGRFKKTGKKFGRYFDLVWIQKAIG